MILEVCISRPPEAGICVSKYIRPEGEGMIGAEPLGIGRQPGRVFVTAKLEQIRGDRKAAGV